MARTAFELQRILVPVDFSGPSELALRYATAFAAHFGGKVALIHVIESGRLAGELSESDTGMTEIPRRVQEQLCSLASRSGEPALFDKVEVRTGRPSKNIDQAASELGGDLIVISTHGYTGLDYVLLGTAERVIRHAPCPVLVVRRQDGRAPEPKKLPLVGIHIDFQPRHRPERLDDVKDGEPGAKGPRQPERVTEPIERRWARNRPAPESLRKGVKLRLEKLHLEVDQRAGVFDTLFREGTSYYEIVAMAQRGDFDLIIMASLGRSGLVDMLLGSTAERVVRHAPCPVLVVREPRESKTQTT